VEGIEADEARCRRQVENSTATVTALAPVLGYDGAGQLFEYARDHGLSIKEAAIDGGFVTPEQFDELTSPEAVCRLGSPARSGRP